MENFFLQVDTSLFFLVNSFSYPWLTAVFQLLSGAGNYSLVWIVLVIVLVIRGRGKPRTVLAVFAAMIISLILSLYVLKPWIGRMRPSESYPELVNSTIDVTGYSFPSGHSSVAFAAAFVLAWVYPVYGWSFWLLAAFIGLSRVYLGVHYPTDVVAGAIVGIEVGYVVVRGLRIGRSKKRNLPK